MNQRTTWLFVAWAIGGFGLTLAVVSPGRLDATSPDSPPVNNVSLSPTPINGVEMILAATGIEPASGPIMVKPDTSPTIELRVKNTTPQSADVEADISISIQPGMNPMSRVGRPMTKVVTQHQQISLAPMESRTIQISTPPVTLQSGGRLVISLKSDGETIRPLELFVKRETVQEMIKRSSPPTTGKAE